MLELVCKWPQSDQREVWQPFCNEVKQPCPLSGWYSHAVVQWGFQQHKNVHLGLLALPLALVDPVASCPRSRNMLKQSGLELAAALELARGAFLIRTRARQSNSARRSFAHAADSVLGQLFDSVFGARV
jgi:hypothetical protein